MCSLLNPDQLTPDVNTMLSNMMLSMSIQDFGQLIELLRYLAAAVMSSHTHTNKSFPFNLSLLFEILFFKIYPNKLHGETKNPF